MPSLSFPQRFIDQIRDGRKNTTIRRTCRFGIGDPIFMFHGPRFRPVRLGQAEVTWLGPIHLDWRARRVSISGLQLFDTAIQLKGLALAEGFEDWNDMAGWFEQVHGPEPFDGYYIKWGSTFRPAD